MKCLVTGGGGFLGNALVRQLLAKGHSVRTYQRGDYPSLTSLNVEIVRGDLLDAQALEKATAGMDMVFHVAAKAGVWGIYKDFYEPNVVGTQNVLTACQRSGVGKLVFTSSPSVVFHGSDESNITESAPYPKRYLAHYPKTKAAAEQMVMAANSASLATIALRPHLIWGPGDPHLVPRILARARAGRLSMIGKKQNLVDSTFIDNAAAAHVLAGEKLSPQAACAGKAYFVSNGEPIAMADLIRRILRAAGLNPVIPHIPASIAYAAGGAMELSHKLLRLKSEPLLTRFVARQLSTAHWFDLTAARRDLGYQPLVSLDEGMLQLAASLRGAPAEVHA